MRWSIMDFSQSEIIKFNNKNPENRLDTDDLLILNWIHNFISKAESLNADGTPASRIWKITDENDARYYNIRYEALLEDLPILNLISKKSVYRKLEKYVEAGILIKKVINKGRQGNFTYFNTTELFNTFLYDNNNDSQKEVVKSTNKQKKTNEVPLDNSVHTNEVPLDNSVHTNEVPLDNSVHSLIYNPLTNLNPLTKSNPSTTTDTKELHSDSKQIQNSVEEVFSKTLIKMFNYNPSFSPDPLPVILDLFSKNNLPFTLLEDYLIWAKEILLKSCKNQDKFLSYYYVSFTKEFYIAKFSDKQKKTNKSSEMKIARITCPVCGHSHNDADEFCPLCKLDSDYLGNKKTITFHKAEWNLSQENPDLYHKYQNERLVLFKKYTVNLKITSQDKYKNELALLEKKYLGLSA